MKTLLFENQLFPVVNYFKKLVNSNFLIIEHNESYQKMSFRNRYVIFGANGLINLSVPIAGGRENKDFMKDIEIDFSGNWQLKHWRAILSSYRKSSYFDYYADDIKNLVFSKEKLLVDYNLNALKWILKQLKIEIIISFTSEYKKIYDNVDDCRNLFLPKNFQHDKENPLIKYPQVFEDRFGFQNNLSVIDLIFACGPNAGVLLKSVK